MHSLTLLMDSQVSDTQDPLKEAVKFIQDRIPEALQKPRVAVVCGSGLQTLGATVRGRVDLPYTSIPGFTSSTGMYRASLRGDSDAHSDSGRPRERISVWVSWYGGRCSGGSHAWTGTFSPYLLIRSS